MSRIIKPPKLVRGSKIGIAAASSSFSGEKFEEGIAVLKKLGFEPVYNEGIFEKQGYLAGSDDRRAAELNRLLSDTDIEAIMFVRGGYGVQRIFPDLDFSSFKKRPKALVGFSDLTALTSYILSELNISAIHGPVITALADGNIETANSLKNILLEGVSSAAAIASEKMKVIKSGEAEGRFVGGCLAIISTGVGTPYQLSTKDSVLFIEDVGEKMYRYDRMLTHLKNSGMLKKVKGVVFGPVSLEGGKSVDESFWDMISGIFKDFDGPVVYGLKSGHASPFYSLPLGVKSCMFAGMDGTVKLSFEEPVLS